MELKTTCKCYFLNRIKIVCGSYETGMLKTETFFCILFYQKNLAPLSSTIADKDKSVFGLLISSQTTNEHEADLKCHKLGHYFGSLISFKDQNCLDLMKLTIIPAGSTNVNKNLKR